MDLVLTLASFGVGIVVGLTGMGGGALMTPILVLAFGVPPMAAVSSDLAASAVMKPFGGFVHARRGTVHWPLVGWLCVGSVPSAFLGVFLLRLIGSGEVVQDVIRIALAVALVLAAAGIVVKVYGRRRANGDEGAPPPRPRPLPTVLLGAVGGLVVGLTSVGSGSLIIIVLLALYPTLRANNLVGTDLVQAIPLVGAAALGHAILGDLRIDIAGTVLLGSIPGVLLGARLSARAPAALIRSALVVVLVASALKLVGLPNGVVVASVVALILVGCGEAVWRSRARRAGRAAAGREPVEARRPEADLVSAARAS
jgi:uncharacterized membrane protein YfcA